MNRKEQPKSIVIVAYEGAAVLDVTGPAEVFAVANRVLETGGKNPAYRISVSAQQAGKCTTASGVTLFADTSWTDSDTDADTIIVAGGEHQNAVRNTELTEWLKTASRKARRVASVCTGAFILAETGLLNGHRASTHWQKTAELAEKYPEITVEPDSIYTIDGKVYTSAGITSGMDLALAMVEEDTDRRTALETAKMLVVYLKRHGGQSQYSSRLKAQTTEGGRLEKLLYWIGENYSKGVLTEELADMANMSQRTFARVFRAETGTTPAAYIDGLRVEHAVQLLEDSGLSIGEICNRCGFGSMDGMRRSFIKTYGITPLDFRQRFGR
jgi:transcriptional regulator GlxA family with amidase domain